MTYDFFVFDFDGTLVDSTGWAIDVMDAMAVRFGFRRLTRAELEVLRGQDNRAVLRELGIPWWRLPQIAAHGRKLALNAPPAPVFPGIVDMLAALHAAGRKLAIVSSNSETAVRRALGADTAALFDAFACNASIFGKASKFRQVLRVVDVDAGRAIAIGDEVRDLQAARAAHMACGAVAWGYATPDLLRAHAPDRFFASPAEIVALVR